MPEMKIVMTISCIYHAYRIGIIINLYLHYISALPVTEVDWRLKLNCVNFWRMCLWRSLKHTNFDYILKIATHLISSNWYVSPRSLTHFFTWLPSQSVSRFKSQYSGAHSVNGTMCAQAVTATRPLPVFFSLIVSHIRHYWSY